MMIPMPKMRKPFSDIGKRIRWDDARTFLAVARTGSLTAAAELLGIGLATVSRQVERLEHGLGLTLFSRHQNGYRLTNDGSALLEKAEILEQAAEAFADGSAAQAVIAGRVRLATAETLASTLIIPALPRFLAEYPGLSIDLVTDVEAVNLHRRDADLALRLIRPDSGNVTVRRLGSLGFGLYASQAYMVQREGGPDGDSYGYLAAAKWTRQTLNGRAPVVTTTSLSTMLEATLAGLGLSILPHFLAARAQLVCLRADLGLDRDIWLVMNSDLARSRRVRLLGEFLSDLIQGHRNALEGPGIPR